MLPGVFSKSGNQGKSGNRNQGTDGTFSVSFVCGEAPIGGSRTTDFAHPTILIPLAQDINK